MNWKKLLTAVVAGAVAGPLAHYAAEVQQGHAAAFTTASILFPSLGGIATALAALFVTPPNTPNP